MRARAVPYRGYIIVEGDWTDPDPSAGPDWLIHEFDESSGEWGRYSGGQGVHGSLQSAKAAVDAEINGLGRIV